MRKFVKLVDSLCVPALLVVACAASAACITVEAPSPSISGSGATVPGSGGGQNGIDSNGSDGESCVAEATDDGSSSAASLTRGSLDCYYYTGDIKWANAVSYCEGLGGGYRLPTKGEARKIASIPAICRTSLPSLWGTWTSTCAGAGLAWQVGDDGDAYQYVVDHNGRALCVR